jgi:hypothetical protein
MWPMATAVGERSTFYYISSPSKGDRVNSSAGLFLSPLPGLVFPLAHYSHGCRHGLQSAAATRLASPLPIPNPLQPWAGSSRVGLEISEQVPGAVREPLAIPRGGRKIVAHGAVGESAPTRPSPGRKKSRPKVTPDWLFPGAFAQRVQCEIIARVGSFAPPGLGDLTRTCHP